MKFLLPILTAALFAGSFVAAKFTTVELEPLTSTLLRYVAALLFLALLALRFQRNVFAINKSDWWQLALLGLTGIVGYHYFFFLSLRFTEVTNTAIINAFSPVVTGVAAAVLLHERLSKRNWLGVAVALVGVLTVLTGGQWQRIEALNFQYGDLLMLVAVASWVAYSLLIKSLSSRYTSMTLTLYATLFGVLWLLLIVWPEGPLEQIESMSQQALVSIIYMGVGASGVGYLCYNLSIKQLGPTRTSSAVYSLVPVFVAVLANVFFEQSVNAAMVASMVLIVIALYLILKPSDSTTAKRR